MATHDASLCCACGATTEMLQWVEGHRMCLPCCETISRDVWVRVREDVAPRPDSDGAAHSALLTIVEEREWHCEEAPAVGLCVVPPMRVMLVGGFHRRDQPQAWVLISVDGELTVDLVRAQLHSFTAHGSEMALVAARRWTDVLGRDCALSPFMARVLVVGNPADPEEVIQAWRFEGDAPTDQKYRFDE